MARQQKSTNLYRTPFCAGYWRDAFAELKDTKMLVFAAMIVVMRVALKTIIRVPLGPSLDITPAFMANALGAMVYGPVVGALGAIVSDVLGVMLRGDTYFLPYVLTEISGSVIFGLFFYRQKITPTRVILSRFSICLFVNILLQTPIDMLYQYVYYGYNNVVLTIPRIFKNLFMFPLEAVALGIYHPGSRGTGRCTPSFQQTFRALTLQGGQEEAGRMLPGPERAALSLPLHDAVFHGIHLSWVGEKLGI